MRFGYVISVNHTRLLQTSHTLTMHGFVPIRSDLADNNWTEIRQFFKLYHKNISSVPVPVMKTVKSLLIELETPSRLDIHL